MIIDLGSSVRGINLDCNIYSKSIQNQSIFPILLNTSLEFLNHNT